MVVYLATTKQHYKKIKGFIDSQPEGSYPKTCFHTQGLKGRAPEELKKAFPMLEIVVVEDLEGKVHAICFDISTDYDLSGEKVKMTKNLAILMDWQDLANLNYDYLFELFAFNKKLRKAQGIRLSQLTLVFPEELLPVFKKYLEMYGDAMRIIHTYPPSPPYTRYVIMIDWVKVSAS